jgi:hypothetical protein
MYIPIPSLITVALTASINASVEVGSESPYGLAFSPTTISASRYNTSGGIEISKFPVGLEYQRYYEDTLRNMREIDSRELLKIYETRERSYHASQRSQRSNY